jgi:hypothetical protein
VSERLSVSPDGFLAASQKLNDHAGKLIATPHSTPAGAYASTTGCANVTAAIAAFNEAYARRVTSHGRSVAGAAAAYLAADTDGGANIGDVPV